MASEFKGKKIFMVGAGGIGCELLKNLVMSGFDDIELIDMDTIDISNLNRQFFFRMKHVGQSKALVARDAALAMNPTASIVAHQSNVMAPEYDVDFFSRFSLVLNALDNVAARRHVNRMCLAAGVPLLDSGTAGFLGQVSTHIKGVSKCYECEAKPTPKGFPTCTITNTPSKPVHCIVWAKELPFQKLFGDKSTPSDLDTVRRDPASDSAANRATGSEEEAAGEGAQEAAGSETKDDKDAKHDEEGKEAEELKEGKEAQGGKGGKGGKEAQGAEASGAGGAAEGAALGVPAEFFTPQGGESLDDFSRRIFDRLFGSNVAETLKMEHMWRTRKKPTPHFLKDILPAEPRTSGGEQDAAANGEDPAPNGEGHSNGVGQDPPPNGEGHSNGVGQDPPPNGEGHTNGAEPDPAGLSAAAKLGLTDEHAVWSLEENSRLFLECVRTFFGKRASDIGSLTFDKDDNLAVEFVTAAANVRAHSFGIPLQSLFSVKGIAGSIIHAVATTNAVVAGLAVLQAMRCLRDPSAVPLTTWCHKLKSGTGKLLESTDMDPPDPDCIACSQTPLVLELNTECCTLGAVVSGILKARVGAVYPTVTHGDALLFEDGTDLDKEEIESYAANAKKELVKFGIKHGSVLTVEDDHQHFKCDIHIKHRDEVDLEQHPLGMILHGKADASSAKGKGSTEGTAEAEQEAKDPGADSDDDLEVIEHGPQGKRGREGDLTASGVGPSGESSDDDLVEVSAGGLSLGKRGREGDVPEQGKNKQLKADVVDLDDD